ncbi:MAG TPA: drug/metabolite exporter YedA [Longimicrobium sp.]|nr:drug/metabolite exporter YedA [Longimicrobium sp.]
MAETQRPTLAKIMAAFAAVYVIWGSTYLGIRFAIETLPPLAMASARFLVAGGVMYAFLRLRGVPAPTWPQWRASALVGVLLLGFGNGGVVLSEMTIPSGVSALLVAMVPAWMVLIDWLRPGGVRPTLRTVIGLAVGFAGMVLLVGPASLSGAMDPVGAGVVVVGSISWAAGSIHSRRANVPASPFMATATEMFTGGVFLMLAAALRGELGSVNVASFSTRSLLALAYLIVFGSLIGFTAYIWLLRVVSPSRVATYAYVNPVVAVCLGWAFASEPITARMLAAAGVIVAAVAIITTGKRAASPAAEVEDEAEPEPAPKGRGRKTRAAA